MVALLGFRLLLSVSSQSPEYAPLYTQHAVYLLAAVTAGHVYGSSRLGSILLILLILASELDSGWTASVGSGEEGEESLNGDTLDRDWADDAASLALPLAILSFFSADGENTDVRKAKIKVLGWLVLVLALYVIIFDFISMYAQDEDDTIWLQHLFWIYGHPEVYAFILPSIPIFLILLTKGKYVNTTCDAVLMVFVAVILTGSFVWGHHLFTIENEWFSQLLFMLTSALVALPMLCILFLLAAEQSTRFY